MHIAFTRLDWYGALIGSAIAGWIWFSMEDSLEAKWAVFYFFSGVVIGILLVPLLCRHRCRIPEGKGE